MDVSVSMKEEHGDTIAEVLKLAEQPIDEMEIKVTLFGAKQEQWPFGWVKLPDANKLKEFAKWLKETQPAGSTPLKKGLTEATQEDGKDISIFVVTDGHFDEATETLLEIVKKTKHPITFLGIKATGQGLTRMLPLAEASNGLLNIGGADKPEPIPPVVPQPPWGY